MALDPDSFGRDLRLRPILHIALGLGRHHYTRLIPPETQHNLPVDWMRLRLLGKQVLGDFAWPPLQRDAPSTRKAKLGKTHPTNHYTYGNGNGYTGESGGR